MSDEAVFILATAQVIARLEALIQTAAVVFLEAGLPLTAAELLRLYQEARDEYARSAAGGDGQPGGGLPGEDTLSGASR